MIKAYSTQTLDEYYIDDETPNKSFIKMALVLKKKGIDNCTFFLKLYNKKLQGVDPFSDKLTEGQQLMILRECANNRWYFFREVFRVGSEGASIEIGGGVRFCLDRGNLAYLWASGLNLSTYMILPRQIGKTWSAVADITHTYQFNKNVNVVHTNKSQSDSSGNITRIKEAIGMLPAYLQHSDEETLTASEKRKVINNDKTIKNILNSKIVAMASAGNEAKADASARGKTAAKLWFDEFAFIFFNKAIYEATAPVFSKASESAIENEVPYGISITTTPGDLATPHGEFAYKFMNECVKFDEEMYDYKAKKLFNIVKGNPSARPFLFIQFSYKQLGKSEEWFETIAKDLGDPIRCRREYLLEWINTNGNSPFDPDDMDVILDLALERNLQSEYVTINKYYKLRVYDIYTGRKPVIISVDVSSGLGRDSSAVVVIHPESLKPLAIFKSNMINPRLLKKFLIKLIQTYFPNNILTIENNSIGEPLIREIEASSIGRYLYKERRKRDQDMGPQSFKRKRKFNDIVYGHNVNADSRAKMMNNLESMVRFTKGHLGYPEIAEELKFLEFRNGRIQHSSSTHDDVIMAYMGGLYIIQYGTGLKGKGIYFNLLDEDDEEYNQDVEAALKSVAKFIATPENEDDAYLNYMSAPQPIETSFTLYKKQREEYSKEQDRINGILLDEDEITFSEDIDNLILKNSKILTNEFNKDSDEEDESSLYNDFAFTNGFWN